MQALRSFQHSLETREVIHNNLQKFDSRRQSEQGLRRAAVAVTVYRGHAEAALMVTKRAGTMREHSGQWALPGGRIDSGETADEAALRELYEEVNLSLSPQNILGQLDDYVTRSGYVITPVVVWADVDDDHLSPNPGEVESIHPFNFSELSRSDSPVLQDIEQSDKPVLSMKYLDDAIYAPTGAVLFQFREVCMLGQSSRVLHYDQPVFAWR